MIFGKKFTNWEVKSLLAVTTALAAAWVFEPALAGTSWLARLVLAGGCLAVTGALFWWAMMRQSSAGGAARRYLDVLCRLDHHELDKSDLSGTFPQLDERNPWRPVLSRVRDRLLECGRRADEADQAWTSAEVRLRRLADERARVFEVLDGLSDPVLAINHYDELVLANRSAKTLLAIDPEADGPRALRELVLWEPLVELLIDTRRRKSPSQRHSEIELPDQRGRKHWYRVTCRALVGAGDGQTDQHGGVAVLTDVSTEKNIQKRHAEFVSAASHEMRTPLAAIKAYVELLLDGEAEDRATREEFLGVIDCQSDRLQRLIENLLNLARIEAGVVNVKKHSHSLNELLEQAFGVVQPSAEQKEIELKSALSPMYLGVLVDRDMMVQTAINLLSNAIKYTETGGKVTLRSRMEESAAVFEVQDTGVGLSEDDCSKVFEKFYRVKKDQQMATGTGLGLPLAKHIVEDVHGGQLTVASQPGRGSTFRVALPNLGQMKG